jgi:hypothetical protein
MIDQRVGWDLSPRRLRRASRPSQIQQGDDVGRELNVPDSSLSPLGKAGEEFCDESISVYPVMVVSLAEDYIENGKTRQVYAQSM